MNGNVFYAVAGMLAAFLLGYLLGREHAKADIKKFLSKKLV